jgi:hypothetical protein
MKQRKQRVDYLGHVSTRSVLNQVPLGQFFQPQKQPFWTWLEWLPLVAQGVRVVGHREFYQS